ncbi:formate C-acetyltransferase/glycerol dehydratase family glycyl radical enzyme [Actinotignum sanguinis]|uniref:glycyl radical protein n=1 Tax=Actinotignum sanguinis TaxID=1445614 RepID=UPI00254D230B|nr:formate C-acetyltransferase/glycerol dehydratase family glycyl radical enzyme [Actinotignum sanguinis]MDK7197929.1 formate C-acetyltransferase/glycerol dehydratase family glycyl radical enzyme [Actinotignum sanguinis]
MTAQLSGPAHASASEHASAPAHAPVLFRLAPERTAFLNARMRAAVPSICTERARIVTESARATEGEPAVLRRAKALRATLAQMSIFIDEAELIVGNHGSTPRSAPLFPEFGPLSEKELDLMPVRKVDTLRVTPEQKRELLEEIYPYWVNRSNEDLARHLLDPETNRVLDSDNRPFDTRSRARSGYGHYIPHVRRIINGGFIAVEEEARARLNGLERGEPDYSDRRVFYEAILIVVDAVRIFQERFAALAEDMASATRDAGRAAELRIIAENCRQVPYRPARTFWEACQSYWFVMLIDYCSQNGSAISAGRFDQYCYPYLKADLDSGRLTRPEAQTILDALWVKHIDIIKACTYSSARNNGGFSTSVALTLGGVDENGENAVNELSYMCLDAEQAVFNSEPNVSIRVSHVTPDAFLDRVLRILVTNEGGKDPFFNDDVIIPGLVKHRHMSLTDARDWAIVGCVEPTGQGNTMGRTNSCHFNLAKCLELALHNGRCPLSGDQLGPRTGDFTQMTSFDQVKEAYAAQVDYFVEMMVSTLNTIELLHARETPHIYSSAVLDGCLESGRDCTAGGAHYDATGVNGVGLPDVVDSLEVIREMVFEKKTMSAAQLLEATASDFADEVIQHRCLNVPKYGNDLSWVDDLASFVTDQYTSSVYRFRSPHGGYFIPGLFSLSSNTPMGRQVGALPSGRAARTPLGDGGISPKHGMDTNGPTAVVSSVASWDHSAAINGVNLNMKFVPAMLKQPADRQKLIDLIRSYFVMGGMHIQFNILSGETLRAAQREPEKYRGLVVRVAGYSAFFVELDREIQDEIISRTVQEL